MEDNNDIIFKYYEADAFNVSGSELIILNKEDNNFIYRTFGYIESEKVSTIETKKIEEIKKIVSDSRIYEIEEIEFPLILDGTTYKYTFNNGKIKMESKN